ncbi:hypothetical protein FOA52_007633 [Chlamydomonas sp. UWO 241]|nr:hypothetical protein FOA52_007633 [Chlamydomonas sp. UWO 241]
MLADRGIASSGEPDGAEPLDAMPFDTRLGDGVIVSWHSDGKSVLQYIGERMASSASEAAAKLLVFVTRVAPGAADTAKIDAWSQTQSDVQVFTLEELQFNKTRHFLVPKHELVDDPAAIAQLLERFKLKATTQLPLMLQSDAICKYFNGKPGSVMRIERVSPSSSIAILGSILNNSLYDSTSTVRSTFVNALHQASTERAVNDAFAKVATSADNALLTVAADQAAFRQLLEDNVFSTVITLFGQESLPPIEMHVADTPIPNVYMDRLIALLANMMNMLPIQITTNCANIPQAASTNCAHYRVRDITLLGNMVKRIEAMLQDTLSVDMAPSFNQYLSNVYVYFASPVVFADVGFSKAELNMFFVVFTPMFMMLYLTFYIPSRTHRAGSSQLRSATARRWCILNIYKVFMYTLYATYRKSLTIAPSSASTARIQSVLDSFVNEVFQPEFKHYDTVFKENIENEFTRAYMTSMVTSDIEGKSREIQLLRSQTVNVVANQAEHRRALTRATFWRWFWFALLVLYIALAASTVWRYDAMWRGFLVASSVLLLTISIIAIQRYTTTFNVDAHGVENGADADNRLNQASFPGFTADDDQRLTTSMKEIETTHQGYSGISVLTNTLGNMNTFVGNAQASELQRMSALNQRSTNDQYKMRETYRDVVYRTHEARDSTTATMQALFTLAVCATASVLAQSPKPATLSTAAAWTIIVIVVAVYITVAVFNYRGRVNRRRDAWDKYYFGPPVRS